MNKTIFITVFVLALSLGIGIYSINPAYLAVDAGDVDLMSINPAYLAVDAGDVDLMSIEPSNFA